MTMKTEDQIRALEKKFWQTMVDKDVAAASALMAESCIITGAQGASAIDKAAFAKMMAGGKWTLKEYSFDKVVVLTPSPGVAVIGYQVKESVTMDGKDMSFEAADASTWVKKGDDWLCVLHTESVLGDPFGQKTGK